MNDLKDINENVKDKIISYINIENSEERAVQLLLNAILLYDINSRSA